MPCQGRSPTRPARRFSTVRYAPWGLRPQAGHRRARRKVRGRVAYDDLPALAEQERSPRAAIIGGFTTLLDTAFDHAAESSTSFAEQSLTAFTDLVWAAQNHPLVLRELNAEAGEPSPILPSTSGAVMEVSLPLVAERLERIGMTTDDARRTLIRSPTCLSGSRIPGHRQAAGLPLTTRDEVAEYARECFGPYLRAVTEQADLRMPMPMPMP